MARLSKKAAQATAANLAATVDVEAIADATPDGPQANGRPFDFTPAADRDPAFDRADQLELLELRALCNRQSAVICQAAENAEELRRSRRRVEELEVKAENAKKNAAIAKKAHEMAIADHFALEDELSSDQQKLPFPPPEEGPQSTAPPPEEDDEEDVCDSVPLDALGMDPGLQAILTEAGIYTLGELCDWTAPPPKGKGKLLTDIAGIGPAKVEKILDATMKFWRDRNDAELAAGCREAEAIRDAVAIDAEIREGLLDGDADAVQDVYGDEGE